MAAECVTLAETKDHLNWELIGEAAKRVKGDHGKALRSAFEEVESQEDEHLYHTTGWCRELLDRLPRNPRRPPAARRAKGCENSHRSGAC